MVRFRYCVLEDGSIGRGLWGDRGEEDESNKRNQKKAINSEFTRL